MELQSVAMQLQHRFDGSNREVFGSMAKQSCSRVSTLPIEPLGWPKESEMMINDDLFQRLDIDTDTDTLPSSLQ